MLKRTLIVFSMIILRQPVAEAFAAPVLAQAANQSPVTRPALQTSPAGAAGCQWTYYPISGGQLHPEQLLYNDPDNTPISSLSVGNPFKSNAASLASLATTGSTDFDGDGETDVFRTWPRADGNLQWQYSSGGFGAWQNLAYASSALPAALLQFGEFDRDTHTDVFANSYGFPNYQWVYSSSGTNSFVLLHTTPDFSDRLALGDFNGDGKTDVFNTTFKNETYQWAYYPGGNGNLGGSTNLAYAATDPALLRFGDFDGDGKTDVFAADQLSDGSTQWKYSSGGAASYSDLITTTVPYSELRFGDFDGDGKTDVLAALPRADGGLQVTYWPGGLGAGVGLGHIPAPAPVLRVGDFNGDGIDDLMALRCGMAGPLAFGPRQILANSGYGTFYHFLVGDVDGDGQTDLILVSTCQNPNQSGGCATHYLQLGTTLGTPADTYTLVAPQQLGAANLDFTYSKALQGDFDGDGKTDVALIIPGNTNLVIYVAHSNGDGTFTLGTPQTFGGENWNVFNPIVGDFDGDGKPDLAFTTVCNTVALYAGSCTNGDNNSVYIATSTGGVFTMGARQDLGPATDWGTYYAFAGDFNGDGKTDLVFNSTCQKNAGDSTCTLSDANFVYTALSNGVGGFALSAKQTYGSVGWSDYHNSLNVVGDVNGDGRSDLVWSSAFQSAAKTHNNVVVAALANPDGTFQLGSFQNFGSDWTGYVTLADLNHDGKADVVWNNAPLGDSDVDTYAAATSSGDGTFNSLGAGAVYTGLGYFQMPETNAGTPLPTGLALLSVRQDSISSALVVVNGGLPTATLTPTPTPESARTNTSTPTPTNSTPTAIAAQCAGDCDGNGAVTVDEIIILVNIDLGSAAASVCPHGTPSLVEVDITLIVKAVGFALNNCPAI